MISPEASEKKPVKWCYTVWGVLFLLSLLGPFGLFFLWKSSSFGKASKWVWTVAILVLTGVLVVTAELLPLWIAQRLGSF